MFIFHRSSPLNNVDGSSLLIQRQAAWWEALAFIETTMYSNNIELKLVELLALLCNINSRHWGVFLHNGWVGPLHNSHCWQANSLPLCSPLSSIETSTMQEYVVWSYSLQVTCLPWLSRTALLGSVHAIYRKKSGHGFWLTPRRLGACRHSRENSAGAPKPGKKREFLPEELKPLELQGFSLQGDLSLQSYTPFILPRRTWRYYLASHYYRALWPK